MAYWQDRNYLRATGAAVVLAMSIGMAAAEESALLAPGVAAYQSGKTDQAIKALSGVLAGGTASGTDVARAYYFRGLAYSKSGKPAQAIADLNNALWLKGLAPDEQANAYLARGKAYQATGLDQRAAQDFRAAEKLVPGAAGQELAAVQATETAAPAGIELQNNQAPAAETSAEPPADTGSAALVLTPSTVQTTAKKKSSEAISTATVGGTATTTAGPTADGAGTLRERGGTVSRTSSSEALSTATVPSNNGSIFSGGGDFFSNLFSTGSSSEPAVTESISAPAVAAAPAKRKTTTARGESADFSTTAAAVETPPAAVVASNEPVATATDAPLLLVPAATEAAPAETSFVAETSTAEPQVSSWSSETVNEQASFAATTEAAPAQTGGSETLAGVGTSVGSFFESLFSGNQPADATGTASQGASQLAAQEVQVAAIEPAAQPVIEAAPAVAPASGRYRAQIATVRTPEEAQIIARRMQTERKALLGDRQANVEPVVLGNMGTFYAVMVGPFADERSSEKFCGKLEGQGLDCFVAEP